MSTRPSVGMSPGAAFARYETIRARLPLAIRQGAARPAESLATLSDSYDLFVLDSFGVLNVGERPISGAVARIAALRAAGKSVAVLTNAAAQPAASLLGKYHRLGFDFQGPEVVSSRSLALEHLARAVPDGAIAVIGDAEAIEHPAIRLRAVGPDAEAAALLILDASVWDDQQQGDLAPGLLDRVKHHPCPIYVANPDLVAPRETGLSVEPGHYAHDLMDRGLRDVRFFGKPFGDAFAAIEAKFPEVPRHRIAMIGDTLQTDILGGLARGWGTILVTDHGALCGLDVGEAIAQSGLHPDWVIPSI